MNLLRYRLHLSSGHGALASMLYDPEGAWVNIQDVEAYLRKNAEIKPDQSTHDEVAKLKAMLEQAQRERDMFKSAVTKDIAKVVKQTEAHADKVTIDKLTAENEEHHKVNSTLRAELWECQDKLKYITSGWRSVYEDMPPENVDVLVWIRRYAVIAQRVGTTEEGDPVFVRADDYVSIHPIYWQPITPPTNE
jgi:predicted RNase H-like nuclease (RuvC/YqgF family)